MAVRGTTISRNFDKFKAKGMSDTEAMQKAIGLNASAVQRERAAQKKRKKLKRTSKTRMAITGKLRRRSHSPAGQAHLRSKGK